MRTFLLLPGMLLGCLLSGQDFQTTTALLGDLRGRQIGPAAMSGRISCLTADPGDANTVYIGTGGGGVWRTTDGGGSLQPIFDDHTQSIGAIALAPSQPKTVYVGTGEPWVRNSVSVGSGVYRSTDGGNKWQSIGLDSTERISAIAVHPDDPEVAYVAALGPLWSDGTQRGVFKTTDGGSNWERVLYLDESTGAASISMHPTHPDTLFAAMWSHRRYPYSFDSGYKGTSGLYRSGDGGASWELLKQGLPTETLGRIAVAIAPGKPEVVYASVETANKETTGMYRSDDGGDTWALIDNSFNNRVRPFYFANITVDPGNDSIVAKAAVTGIISEDGGQKWRNLGGPRQVHADHHAIWIDPADGKHLLVGTDGGVYESRDRGKSFRMWNNLPVSQFYHVSVDNATPYRVYGGLQDNGSWYGPSASPGGITNGDWTVTLGGDGFYSFRHPSKPHFVFSEYQGGALSRWDERSGRSKSVVPYRDADTDELRFNWNVPIHLSTDGERLYFASQYLYRSTDDGDSWERISPDLTTNDTAFQQQYRTGGLTVDNSGAENYTTIYQVAESPLDSSTIWVGTDDGNLQLTTDGGKSWSQVNPVDPDLPEGAWVTFIDASPHDPLAALVTFDAHRTGDQKTYLYRTEDGGSSWTRLHDEALSGYALSVRQDPVNPDLFFLGTEFGLYISLDAGATWAPFRNNVPQVGIRDMVIHPREADLVLATHGRGIIIIDDLEALRQLTPDLIGGGITFLATDTTYFDDGQAGGAGQLSGSGHFVGQNPDASARIMYYADKRHTFGKMFIEVYRDTQLVKQLQAGKGAGLNIGSLPITDEKPKAPPTDNEQTRFGVSIGPPLAAGEYRVVLTKGKETYTSSFTIAPAPGSPYSLEGRAAQRALLLDLFDDTEQVAYLYEVLDRVAIQAQARGDSTLAQRAGKSKGKLVFLGGDHYIDSGEQLGESVSRLYGNILGYPGAPSESQVGEAARLREEIAQMTTEVNNVLREVDTINKASPADNRIDYPSKETFLATN